VLVHLFLPIAVSPRVVAKRPGVLELLLRDAGPLAAKGWVILQRGPGNWIMAVTEAKEAAETHDSIGCAA
jgi:hypothetical protein